MPYIETYVEPEILFTHEDVPVYLTYKNGDANEPHQYLYIIGNDSGDDDNMIDVRGLDQFGADAHKPIPGYARGREYHKDVIREALAHGELNDVLEEAGFIPGLGAWKLDMHDLNAEQLLQVLASYNDYIQEANEENRYKEGWMPVCIQEYYGAEFQQELHDAKEERQKTDVDIFAYKLSLLDKGVDGAAEDVSDVIAQIEKAKSLLKNDEEDTDEDRS